MLTEQKKLFVDEYIRLRMKNATLAAINAGYSPKSAAQQACQLLKSCEVSDLVNERWNEIRNDLQQEFIFDAVEARKVLQKIMADPNARDQDRITAARDLLDRAGFKPPDRTQMQVQGAVVFLDADRIID